MEYTIIGIEYVDYTNKNGNPVKGYRMHVTYEKKGCDGLAVDTVFLNVEQGASLVVGNIIELYYNKYGRPAHVSVVA